MPDWIPLIEQGREARFLEYKQAESWDGLRHKIVKTCLGLANIRDGGYLIVGVAETRAGVFELVGVPDALVPGFTSDIVRAEVNRFADPATVFVEVEAVIHNGRTFVCIRVDEFESVPHICTRDGEGLRRGAVYVRRKRINETSEIQDQADMREIIDLATDRALQKLLRRVGWSGLPLAAQLADDERFRVQRGGL